MRPKDHRHNNVVLIVVAGEVRHDLLRELGRKSQEWRLVLP